MSSTPTNLSRKGNRILLLVLGGLLLIFAGVSVYLAYNLRSLRASTDEENLPGQVNRGDIEVNSAPDKCRKIDSIPVKIKSPGAYCVTQDLATDKTAIVIQSDNVQIDLGGHSLQGPGMPGSRAIGVYWNSYKNISIENGTIAGFFYGIRGYSLKAGYSPGAENRASNVSVNNLVLLDNSFRGIQVEAAKATIKNNVITNTGGTTVYDDAYSMGIEIMGSDCLVQGNWIQETYPVGVGEGVAISLSDSNDGCKVTQNYISNERLPFPGRSFAFWITTEIKDIQVVNNFARGFTYPFKYPNTDSSVVIARNVFSSMECSVTDYPDYYKKYPYTPTNEFVLEVPGCASDDPNTFLALAQKGDRLAMFRLGEIETNPCMQRYWWGRAAALGHRESIRLSRMYKDAYKKAGCY